MWQASPSLGPSAAVFTGAFVGGSYGPPDGLNWNFGSNDAPVMDDTCLEDSNVAQVFSRLPLYSIYLSSSRTIF